MADRACPRRQIRYKAAGRAYPSRPGPGMRFFAEQAGMRGQVRDAGQRVRVEASQHEQAFRRPGAQGGKPPATISAATAA